MSKRIESIEDLAGIADAELGTKLGESKIEKDAAVDLPVVKPRKTKLSKKPTLVDNSAIDIIDNNEPRDVKKLPFIDHLLDQYNAFEVGYIKIFPKGKRYIKDMRDAPNPINGHTRTLKKNKLPKLIEEEWKRAKLFRSIYEKNLAEGNNAIGFVYATISAEQEAARMEAYLVELEEKA